MHRILFCVALLLATCTLPAQERFLCWKYGLLNGGMHFSIPRAITFTGATFVKKKEDRQLIRRVYNLKLLLAAADKPIRQKDLNRYFKRAKRRNLEEILTIRDGKTQVRIMAKTRRDALRKVVVLVSSPEDGLVLFSMRGKLRIKDINRVLKKIHFKEGKTVKKYLPDMA